MNEYEIIYQVKQEIDEKISKNKLFKLSVEEAALVVIEKVGVLFSISCSSTNKEYLHRYIKTNATEINEISFIQESVKWIFRWCSRYCSSNSQIDRKAVVADDIYNLMGIAYAYEEFYIMWDLHRAKKVRYSKNSNKIVFDYINEDVYKTHVIYDSIFREINNLKEVEKINSLKINKDNFKEAMSNALQIDFNCSFNIEFDGFCLEDYRVFSTELTSIFVEARLSNINKYNHTHTIIPGKEGILSYKKEDWKEKLSIRTKIDNQKINKIIDFFTYDFFSDSSDISLSYFIPHLNNYLMIPEAIFSVSRPEVNAMRLLAKKKSTNYDKAQNNFEGEERLQIKKMLNSKYLMTGNLDKSKRNRPGMDLLVYDKENNHLQIIELKYKIPIESTWDIKKLDEMLDKAYLQIKEAKKYTNDNSLKILNEYFGEVYKHIIPNKIDFFILTNYSIGTGTNAELPTPILLIDHYIKLMNNINGMEQVRTVLHKNDKISIKRNKRYSRFSLQGYKILIPQYSFNLLDVLEYSY